jgi:hypothetical protein
MCKEQGGVGPGGQKCAAAGHCSKGALAGVVRDIAGVDPAS